MVRSPRQQGRPLIGRPLQARPNSGFTFFLMTRPSISRWSRRLATWLASGHVLLLGMTHLPMPVEGSLPPGVCSVRGMVADAGTIVEASPDGNQGSRGGKPLGRMAAHGLSCPLCTGADAAPPPVLLASMDAAFSRSRLPLARSETAPRSRRPVRLVARGPPARIAHFESARGGRLGVGAGPRAAHVQAPSHLIEKPLWRESRKQLSPFFRSEDGPTPGPAVTRGRATRPSCTKRRARKSPHLAGLVRR